jgi:hypothetical protein
VTSKGWVKIHRCMLDKPIWTGTKPEHKAVLITILCLAGHSEKEWIWKGMKFRTQPGQFITSLESLSKASGATIRGVRTALARFEKLEFLTNESTKTGRLITVVNWEFYQSREDSSDKGVDKEVTKDRQRGDKEVTTTKNLRTKELKNLRKNLRKNKPSESDIHRKIRDENLIKFFLLFWEKYPRREAKKDAEHAFRKIFPYEVSDEQCTARLRNMGVRIAQLIAEGRERKHIPLPATFLNREDFDSEPDIEWTEDMEFVEVSACLKTPLQ